MSHEHAMYGFFPGGDPRRFTPDAENGEAARLNHKRACEAFATKGEEPTPGCFPVAFEGGGAIVTGADGFGPGVYFYACDDPECPEAQAEAFADPDDAYAAFERWWAWDGQVIEAAKGRDAPGEDERGVRGGVPCGARACGR